MAERIAVIQFGHLLHERRQLEAGRPEPYFAMGYSIEVLTELLAPRPHLVVGLDSPPGAERVGRGRYVGLPCPRFPIRRPLSPAHAVWACRVFAELDRFRPTHLLLRTGGLVGLAALHYAVRRRINTLVVFASFFERKGWFHRLTIPRMVRLLNRPAVRLVGNHRWPATQSLIDCGLSPAKALAWDWPTPRHPQDYPVKRLLNGHDREIVFAGMVTASKGVPELVEAVGRLRRRGAPVRLTLLGEGDALKELRSKAPDGVALVGRVGNDEVFARMRDADLVCVPSRPEYAEGFPLSLTEALASRTPVLASDHPVFVRGLRDGEGVRFFRAGDAESLAGAAAEVLTDPAAYARLSDATATAFARLECPVTFGDLIERWRALW